jgi:transcriptional regulator
VYLPPQFQDKDHAHAHALMRAHPFASLVSTDASGFPFVSHLPLHLQAQDDALSLLGHCARANPHWRYLQDRPQALVTFQGPHAYMSPQVYPELTQVPTWNYLVVHARVTARMVDLSHDKDRLLKHLIGDHEPEYAQQWRDLPDDFQHRMLQGIVAFELQVNDLQCKLKLNQHRPHSHAAMFARYSEGDASERALAQWMQTLGLVP